MSETRPCKTRPSRTAILRAWNCRSRVLRHIFVYIPPIKYREFCDRIRVSHPVVQRSLRWRDIPRDFSFNIGVRSKCGVIQFCVSRSVTSHLFHGSSLQDHRDVGRRELEREKNSRLMSLGTRRIDLRRRPWREFLLRSRCFPSLFPLFD